MMKLGLIGYPLGHSWSPEIHSFFLKQDCYSLIELKEEELGPFLEKKEFDGLNVTIPYKQKVIPYLDELDPLAQEAGAVNTIVNQNGRLIGHNTDVEGFRDMIMAHGIDVKNGKTAVIGDGGVSKAIRCALKQLGADFCVTSRKHSPGSITMQELLDHAPEYACLINATPLGMKPHDELMPTDPSVFDHLKYAVDVIANPLRTKFLFEAKLKGCVTCGGFEMLVRQAAAADRWFADKHILEAEILACMKSLYDQRRSVVLIGMPTSGKTTIAELLAEETGKKRIEMDEVIEAEMGMKICTCFQERGETYFRDLESSLCYSLKEAMGSVISCGGGVIKRRENMQALAENGLILWLDRPVDLLYGSSDRPLSSDREHILSLYQERRPYYERYADVRIENSGSVGDTLKQIRKAMEETL